MNHFVLLLISLTLLSCGEHPTVYNEPASAIQSQVISFNPLSEAVLSSFIDTRQHRMATLYGNSVAAKHARTTGNADYPAGAVLTLVSWKQQPDPRWFGGNIPGQLATVEVVRFPAATPLYQKYAGRPLRLQPPTTNMAERIQFITHEKTAYLPIVLNH